jgi:hypothetical protein
MEILYLKLAITPIVIAGMTYLGRRFGNQVMGVVSGLPLTSGPLSVYLALEQGQPFAAKAAAGTLAGTLSSLVFAAIYLGLARRLPWWWCIVLGIVGNAISTLLLNHFLPPLPIAFVIDALVIASILKFAPRAQAQAIAIAAPWWDVWARIGCALSLVLLVTGFAHGLGAQLSGLLSSVPIFASVFSAFAHARHGAESAIALNRAMTAGCISFIAFFLVAASSLPHAAMWWAYLLSSLAALGVNASTLWLQKNAARN